MDYEWEGSKINALNTDFGPLFEHYVHEVSLAYPFKR
jgi:hypothetical protein